MVGDLISTNLDLVDICIENVHKLAYKYGLSQFRVIKPFLFKKVVTECFNLSSLECKNTLKNRSLDFISSEIIWFKDMMINDKDEYFGTVRKGREGRLSRLEKESIWEIYEIVKLYQRDHRSITYSDYPNIAMHYAQPIYDFVIIDEAQDLTKADLTFISKLIFPQQYNVMILVDAAQSIYQNGINWKNVGFTIHGSRSVELKQNFRNPYNVYKVAKSIIDLVSNKEDFINNDVSCANENISFSCPKPRIYLCNNQDVQFNELLKVLYELPFGQTTVVVLVKTCDELKSLSRYLSAHYLNYINLNTLKDSDRTIIVETGVYLSTMHSIKGLEFDYVILLNLNDENFSFDNSDLELTDKILKLIYTCLTRAMKNFYIFSSSCSHSKIIDKIDVNNIELINF